MVESAEVFKKYNVPFKTEVYTAKIGEELWLLLMMKFLPAGFMTQKRS
jgi:peptidyl-prolyl cis-trans isomerase SurA